MLRRRRVSELNPPLMGHKSRHVADGEQVDGGMRLRLPVRLNKGLHEIWGNGTGKHEPRLRFSLASNGPCTSPWSTYTRPLTHTEEGHFAKV
jgi:hypothetical protein